MLRLIGIRRPKGKSETVEFNEAYYLASQRQLVWRKFRRHRLAMSSLVVIIFLYSLAIFAEFYTINDYRKRHVKYAMAPPQALHFIDETGRFHLVPFIYQLTQNWIWTPYGAITPKTLQCAIT